MDQRDTILTEIAAKHLFLETLETRMSDRLDFHDTAVWAIKDALEAAYEAGRQSREPASPKRRSKNSKVVDQPRKKQTKSTT